MSTITTPSAVRGPDGLAVIGRTLHDLRGVRFDEGEGGNAAGTTTGAAAGTGTTGATTSTTATDTTAASTTAAAGQTSAATEKVEDLPAWAQKLITDTRSEAAKYRTEGKTAAEKAQQELTDKLAVALGLKPDAAADPAALTASLTTAQKQAEDAARQLAVFKAATNIADPTRLLDRTSFMTSIAGLDPNDGAALKAAIEAAVAADSTLKKAQAAGASTVDTSGGTGETGQITEEQLARMTPEEIVEAQKKGLLRNLLT